MGSALADPPLTRTPGKYERKCFERHERDLALSLRPEGHPKGFVFDLEAGDRTVTFIEKYCKHSEGEWAGQLIVLEEWQRAILRIVFGWKRADGTRRFRTAYIEIPRKNGKSLKGAAVGLYLTVADGEEGAQVYSAATKKDQAKIVHDAATKMVKRSASLKRFVKTFRNNISCERMGSKFEPLGADSSTLDGLNTHGLIEDETHAHTDRHVHDVLVTSMGARRQPLAWVITTAGVYDPESIGWELHERARQVLDGAIEDDSFFAIIYAADAPDGEDWTKSDAWQLPEKWAQANPNLGVSVKRDYLETESNRAATTPSYLNTFLRYHLNIWTQQVERWIPIEYWNACARVVDEEKLQGKHCFAALDLSSKLDITALVLAFPSVEEGQLALDFVFRFWCPEETIKVRAKQDLVPYDAWVRDGWMIATPGNVVDYTFPIAAVKEFGRLYSIREMAFDPWNATQTANDLQEEGVLCVECGQGYKSMSEPSKEFEKLVVSGMAGHLTPRGAHPVMRWMVSNVAIKRDPADNIKPDKSSTKGRIDGVVAAIMATGRAIVEVDNTPSVTVIPDVPGGHSEYDTEDDDIWQ